MKRPGPFLRLAWLLFAALAVSLPATAALADLHAQRTEQHIDDDASMVDAQGTESEPDSGSHRPNCPICHFLTAHAIAPAGHHILESPSAVAAEPHRVQGQREHPVHTLRPLPRAPPIS
jgi:hypothetical protein